MAGSCERINPTPTSSQVSPENQKIGNDFYPNTISTLRQRISTHYPEKTAREDLEDIVSHCLWMLERIETMEDSPKAGRWIGYVFGRLEALGLLSNQDSRDMVRVDVKSGHQ